jgi:OmpA-OmpF porin, OOP family
MNRALLALGILLIATAPALAQQDEEGCKDHPVFSRMPGFHISGCDSDDPSSFEFEVPGGPVKVEGHYWKIDYWVKDNAPQPTTLQVVRNYLSSVAAKGGTKLLERVSSSEGTLTAKMPGPKGSGTIWLQVHVTMEGEVYSLTIVQEKPPVR